MNTSSPSASWSLLLGLPALLLCGCPAVDIGGSEARERAQALVQEKHFDEAARLLAEAASRYPGHPQSAELDWYKATLEWQALLDSQERPGDGAWSGGVECWAKSCAEMDHHISVQLLIRGDTAQLSAGGTQAEVPLKRAGRRLYGAKEIVSERELCGYLSLQAVLTGRGDEIEVWLAYDDRLQQPDPDCPSTCSWSGVGRLPFSSGQGP